MGNEKIENVVMVCTEHSSKPMKEYFGVPMCDVPLEQFKGKYVKKRFTTVDDAPTDQARFEHMWVRVTGIDEDEELLVGELNNDPVLDVGFSCGDIVQVDPSEIEAVMD